VNEIQEHSTAELAHRKEELDVSKIFLAFLHTAGDVTKTAQVADVSIKDVLYLSRVECWAGKLAGAGRAAASSPEDGLKVSQELNRCANYVQAVRLRALIDQTIHWVYENEENLGQFLTEVNKQGKKLFSTKPLLDLTKAAETAHAITYRALGDTVAKASEDDPSVHIKSLQNLHLHIVKQMGGESSERSDVSAQLDNANPVIAKQATDVMGYLDAETTEV